MFVGLSGYMSEHNQAFPFMGTPGDPGQPLNINGASVSTDGSLFFRYQSWYWASIVLPFFSGHPSLADGEVFIDHGAAYGAPPERIFACRYFMTNTAFAVPEFWQGTATPADLSLLRGTRITHMRNPARKGVLIDAFAGFLAESDNLRTAKVLVTFGDGAVRLEPQLPQAPYVERPYTIDYWPIMATEGGLAGIDF